MTRRSRKHPISSKKAKKVNALLDQMLEEGTLTRESESPIVPTETSLTRETILTPSPPSKEIRKG